MLSNILKKKAYYPISNELQQYLIKYKRTTALPVNYQDLLRFTSSLPHTDKNGKETLWETVLYSPSEINELNQKLVQIYALMKFGNVPQLIDHLQVDRIDFCDFGNSKPFRIRIVNNYNDNHDYYYIKIADASRVFGLELEDILSPNRIQFLVNEQTLIEEHIAGIPGDEFINQKRIFNEVRVAKEFIKFNERCFIRLLGDMRSYNFVMVITEDFDDIQYRFRAIDFDQQSYESNKNFYTPTFFKENRFYTELCIKNLNPETVQQYKIEERVMMGKRYRKAASKLNALFSAIDHSPISKEEKIKELRISLAQLHQEKKFLNCTKMGELVALHLEFSLQN